MLGSTEGQLWSVQMDDIGQYIGTMMYITDYRVSSMVRRSTLEQRQRVPKFYSNMDHGLPVQAFPSLEEFVYFLNWVWEVHICSVELVCCNLRTRTIGVS
jgi:hypothetical protein